MSSKASIARLVTRHLINIEERGETPMRGVRVIAPGGSCSRGLTGPQEIHALKCIAMVSSGEETGARSGFSVEVLGREPYVVVLVGS